MYKDEYTRWARRKLEDADLAAELSAISGNDAEIEDRFGASLAFGTAGLRGVIGAGTNRMNIYTVRQAAQGMAAYLLEHFDDPTVAVSYDSRIKSDLFAREAACVFAANNVGVYLYPRLEPVPALSFATRHLQASAGVMVTASHNPATYNGFKAYGPDGCQLSTDASAAVLAKIAATDIFEGVKTAPFDDFLADGRISYIKDDVLEAFYANVKAQSVRPGIAKSAGLAVVYSPLNGAGNVPVRRVLADMGFQNVTVVPQQENPDGNFPTCPFPNPEVRESLALGLAMAEGAKADLMLATDPDADRVGIAVPDKAGEYHLLSGNEVGVLLLDYICAGRKETGDMPARPVMVKSVVSTPMADAVAAKYGVTVINILTGFKYIGEQIRLLEEKSEKNRFIFGFEESYGYLAGTYVRDKDAVVASMLICEMAAWHKTNGTLLYDALQALYAEHGRYLSTVENYEFDGLAGMEKMAALMDSFRQKPFASIGGHKAETLADYETGLVTTGATAPTGLPKSNMLLYHLSGGHTLILRPSGTEPKIKAYYTTKGATLAGAEAIQKQMSADVKPLFT